MADIFELMDYPAKDKHDLQFNNGNPQGVWDAMFSPGRKYRYALWRIWGSSDKGKVMFIGLNPSTADESLNDPTIRRCIGFAKDWGYGGMFMCNLFSYVSTDPKALITSGEPLDINNYWLEKIAECCDKVVFAWGAFKMHKERMLQVAEMFPEAYCIGKSKEGFPKHPLYLAKNSELIKYRDIEYPSEAHMRNSEDMDDVHFI